MITTSAGVYHTGTLVCADCHKECEYDTCIEFVWETRNEDDQHQILCMNCAIGMIVAFRRKVKEKMEAHTRELNKMLGGVYDEVS